MKIISIAAAFALLAAGVAHAQQPPDPPKPPPHEHPGKPDDVMKPGPRLGPDARRPPPSKAAHYRVQVGETKIDLKCADDEPAKACADLFLQVIDKVVPK